MFVYKQDGDLLKTLSSGLPLTGFVRINTRKSPIEQGLSMRWPWSDSEPRGLRGWLLLVS